MRIYMRDGQLTIDLTGHEITVPDGARAAIEMDDGVTGVSVVGGTFRTQGETGGILMHGEAEFVGQPEWRAKG
jgi:hypothetical protein